MTEHYYYSLGSAEKMYVSNSLLNTLDTEIGGSPNKCKEFIDGDQDRKVTLSMENGTIIHRYQEDKDNFILEAIKPPEQTEYLTKYIFDNFVKSGQEVNGNTVLTAINQIREERNLYGNTKDEVKLVEKFKSDGGAEYLAFLKNSEGKIAITPAQENTITNSINSLKNNAPISRYLFADDTDQVKHYKEMAIIFSAPVPLPEKHNRSNNEPVMMNFKVLLDNFTVDYKNKCVINTDLKTTGKSIYKYHSDKNRIGGFEYTRTYRQLGMYDRAVEMLLNGRATAIDNQGMSINFIFSEPQNWKRYSQIAVVETSGYFKSGLFTINNQWLMRGKNEVRELLQRLAWHISNNIWDMTIEEYELNGKFLNLQEFYPKER